MRTRFTRLTRDPGEAIKREVMCSIGGGDTDVWKRWTICLLRGHGYDRVAYSPHSDSGFYRRCRRCGHEDHSGGSVMPTGAGM